MIITLSFLASAFDVFVNIIIFLLVLSLVICLHELGHLFFAKKAGVLCHEFSFGMGPKVWSKKKGETTYSIRAIPFGGFVSMAGEELESEVVEVGDSVRLGFDENQNVVEIIVDVNDKRYQKYPEVRVSDIDLKNRENLHINEYKVDEEALYVTSKNKIQIAPKDRRFSGKTKKERFLIAFGGPLMNFILAFIIYLLVAFSLGVPDGESTVVGEVSEDMPAENVLQAGDKIVSINGVIINSWSEETPSIVSELDKSVSEYEFVVERDAELLALSPIEPKHFFYNLGFTLKTNTDELIIDQPIYVETELKSGDKIISIDGQEFSNIQELITFSNNFSAGSTEENPTTITVDRDGNELTFEFVAYSEDVLNSLGYDTHFTRIGIETSSKFSFLGSFGNASQNFAGAATMIFSTIRLLFISNNNVGVNDLSGFVGIFSMVRQASTEGFVYLIQFIALLSVNLGILNLLPIPALDGGRIVFIGYEAITKKKPNQKVENWLHTIVFFLLISLMIYVTYHDILRLIGI
ncbi:MAG: RIP metalloprotease RseP [Bacillota bacterium]